MTELNESIKDIPIPYRMLKLPISNKGYPVPWFVAMIKGEWDFRVIAPGRPALAVREKRCWLCGELLGIHLAFVTGPMCVITRTSAEPPSHLDCAQYSVRACPFLTQPRMRRNDKGLPEEGQEPGGIFIKRNPGVTAILITRSFVVFNENTLIRMGEPERVEWYAEGRKALRAEVQASIDSGIPLLEQEAKTQRGGIEALQLAIERMGQWLPAALDH